MDHCNSRCAGCGNEYPDHASSLHILVDNDTAPCVFVAEALLIAAAIHSVVDLDIDGIASGAAAAP